MKCCNLKNRVSLYAVTDRSRLGNQSLEVKVEQAIKGGAGFIQLREKNANYDEMMGLADKIKTIAKKYDVPFVINDSVEIALAADADGVHLGQSDEAIEKARKMLGDDKIIGATAHNVCEAIAAEKAGADYLGVGACFGSKTKNDTIPLSYDELCRICKSVSIPVVAIGGIDETNIAMLEGSGISGVAVVSALFAVENTYENAKLLRRKIEKILACN